MNTVLKLTATIEREGDGYVSTCPELDIVSEGRTIEEARLNLLEVASVSEIRRRFRNRS
jgi:predicted RNase H-like HicB family nuclease